MHRAPKGALRPREAQVLTGRPAAGQKAPSATRCIKTVVTNMGDRVRCNDVREHRAPNGALRLGMLFSQRTHTQTRQKTPSAKRCIKTT